MRYLELRRHTQNDGDRLTPEGVAAAEKLARSSVNPPYAMFVSTGAWRASEVLTIVRRTAKQTAVPIIDEPELRSRVERQWRDAAKEAGDGADLEALRAVDPELVEKETWQLGLALRSVVSRVPDGGRALVVGHTPTTEAAVLGLTNQLVAPLGYGEGVLIVEDAGRFEVSRLD